jgi:hypothetical protein
MAHDLGSNFDEFFPCIERLKLELRLAPRSLGPQSSEKLTSLLKPLSGMEIDLIDYSVGCSSSNPCMRSAHCTPTTAPFTGCSSSNDKISVSGK